MKIIKLITSLPRTDNKLKDKNMTEWIHVNSTAIRRVGYNAESMQMFIDFEDSNPVYTFYSVPEHIFRSFVTARSVGQYYHQHIKDRYRN